MTKSTFVVLFLIVLPTYTFSQATTFTSVKTKAGDVKIPGSWKKKNTMDDSGQTYLKNKNGI